jgi:3-oxoacid CoA-transferase subunit B
MGGAMDLVASAENIIVAMMHVNKKSQKFWKMYPPLTGVGCVKNSDWISRFTSNPQGFKLLERAQVSVEHIIASTEAVNYWRGYSGGDLTSLLSKY